MQVYLLRKEDVFMSKINSKKGKAKISLLTCILYLLFICFNIVATNYNITAMAASVYKFDFGSESSPVASGYIRCQTPWYITVVEVMDSIPQ